MEKECSPVLNFYGGLRAIAQFLNITPAEAQRLCRRGKIPAKKDMAGKWVLCELDYFWFLEGQDDQHH